MNTSRWCFAFNVSNFIIHYCDLLLIGVEHLCIIHIDIRICVIHEEISPYYHAALVRKLTRRCSQLISRYCETAQQLDTSSASESRGHDYQSPCFHSTYAVMVSDGVKLLKPQPQFESAHGS